MVDGIEIWVRINSRLSLRQLPMSKTYAQIAKEIATLQAEAGKLFAAEAKEAAQQVNALIDKYQLSAQDLRFAGAPSEASAAVNKSPTTASPSSNAAVFSDGKGNSWGGRGPRPKWLRDAIDSGQDQESFKVRQTADLPGKQSAAKTTKKISLPAKFRHPESGDVWSGRGSQPRWLKIAMKKRGARLEDFALTSLTAPVRKGVAGADKARPSPTQAAIGASTRNASAPKKSVTQQAKANPAAKPVQPVAKADVPFKSSSVPSKARASNSAKVKTIKATATSAKSSSRPATKTKAMTGTAKKQTKRLGVAKPAGKKKDNAGASPQKAATTWSPKRNRAAKKVSSKAARDMSPASPVVLAPTATEVAGTETV